ncbi:hypothetical protein DL767_008683 [Monosporascus sp. MG133]|nr:hypothetical protein DL767_008683 [Monosporascus sp. MG133]
MAHPNGYPQVIIPAPRNTVPGIRMPDFQGSSEAQTAGQRGYGSASSISKPENEAATAHLAIAGARSEGVETLDRDLWAAAQSIAATRQERIAVYRALDDANVAYADLERRANAAHRMYEQQKVEYHKLAKHHKKLCEQHKNLNDQYNRIRTDLATLKDGSELQAVKIMFEDEKALRDALELQLQQAKDELTALEDWKHEELRVRDLTIDKLQGDVQRKSSELGHLAEKLELLEEQNRIATETMQDYEAKTADIAGLKAENNKLQEEAAALEAQIQPAKLAIQALEEVQNVMEENHAQALQQLQQENTSLREALKAAGSSCEVETSIHAGWEQSETEKGLLRDENTSLRQQLEIITNTLVKRFPDLHDNLDNLSSVLAGNWRGGRKRRKTAK